MASTCPAGCEMQVEFMENPSLGAYDWREPIQYDVVACMFAIHYFFASEDIVRTLLYNVAQNLKDGEQLGDVRHRMSVSYR